MRYFKEYFINEIIVPARYLFQTNFHQKLYTAPYEPHRPWNISWSHFVCAVSNSGVLLWMASIYWKWVSLSALFNLARRNSHSGQDLVGMEQVGALVWVFFLSFKKWQMKSTGILSWYKSQFSSPFLQFYCNWSVELPHCLILWYVVSHDDSCNVEENQSCSWFCMLTFELSPVSEMQEFSITWTDTLLC